MYSSGEGKIVHYHHRKKIIWQTLPAFGKLCMPLVDTKTLATTELFSLCSLFMFGRKVPHWSRVVCVAFFLRPQTPKPAIRITPPPLYMNPPPPHTPPSHLCPDLEAPKRVSKQKGQNVNCSKLKTTCHFDTHPF